MWEVKGLVAAVANHLGFLDSYAFLRREVTKSQVAILLYHRTCPEKGNWSLGALTPQGFEKQMEYLCRNYEMLALEELVHCIQRRKPLPRKAVVVTFDDGYRDSYLYAYPILKRNHIPLTMFLSTGYIGSIDKLFWWDKVSYLIWHAAVKEVDLDELGSYSLQSKPDKLHARHIITERLKKLSDQRKNLLIEKLHHISGVEIPAGLGRELILTWDEVREMSNNGIIFGAHSVNHPVLTNLPLERAKWEIIHSKKDIEEKLGKEVTAFSYPNGDFGPELVKFIKGSGFSCAVTAGSSKLVASKDDPYELSSIGPGEDLNKSEAMLCGLWGDFENTLGRRSK